MQIVMKKVNDLIPYINNPRKNDDAVDKVASSIKNFGFKVPLVIDSKNEVVTGHTRLKAAKKLGLEEVPCIIAEDLSEAQIKAFRIADNRVAEESEWDFDLLDIELKSLEELDFNIDELGFEDKELDEITKAAEETEVVEDDFDEEPPENPISKRGDIWLLGKHRLMCGDSTSEDVNILMDGKKANVVHTDPPYGVAYTGNKNPNTKNSKNSGVAMEIKNDKLEGKELEDLFNLSMKQAYRHTTDKAAFYIWYATSKITETVQGVKNADLDIRAFIFWYKINSPMSSFMSQYIPNYEPLLYCFKNGKSPEWYGPNNEKCIWEQQVQLKNRVHPTQKPIELPARAIKNSTQENGLVLDLFGGSGSTLIATEQLNRIAYLMELDEKYVDVIVNRYINFKESDEDVFLIRDGVKIPFKEVQKCE